MKDAQKEICLNCVLFGCFLTGNQNLDKRSIKAQYIAKLFHVGGDIISDAVVYFHGKFDILTNHLLPMAQTLYEDNMIFQHDNNQKPTAVYTKQWVSDENVQILD